jgi:hypothetical protein
MQHSLATAHAAATGKVAAVDPSPPSAPAPDALASAADDESATAGHVKFMGVCAAGKRFRARGWLAGKGVELGSHATAKEAARAYDAWAVQHGRELNFPAVAEQPAPALERIAPATAATCADDDASAAIGTTLATPRQAPLPRQHSPPLREQMATPSGAPARSQLRLENGAAPDGNLAQPKRARLQEAGGAQAADCMGSADRDITTVAGCSRVAAAAAADRLISTPGASAIALRTVDALQQAADPATDALPTPAASARSPQPQSGL